MVCGKGEGLRCQRFYHLHLISVFFCFKAIFMIKRKNSNGIEEGENTQNPHVEWSLQKGLFPKSVVSPGRDIFGR